MKEGKKKKKKDRKKKERKKSPKNCNPARSEAPAGLWMRRRAGTGPGWGRDGSGMVPGWCRDGMRMGWDADGDGMGSGSGWDRPPRCPGWAVRGLPLAAPGGAAPARGDPRTRPEPGTALRPRLRVPAALTALPPPLSFLFSSFPLPLPLLFAANGAAAGE